jgi:ubiquinone/menaquinone biosynthesis C-methylase UbiE
MTADKSMQFFYEIYEAMPRQGPGDRASTERALSLLPPVTNQHRVLDIGCGTGAQTLDLARATARRKNKAPGKVR